MVSFPSKEMRPWGVKSLQTKSLEKLFSFARVCVMVVVFLSFASFRFLFLFFKELEGKKE